MLLDNNDIIKFQRIISLFILFIRFCKNEEMNKNEETDNDLYIKKNL